MNASTDPRSVSSTVPDHQSSALARAPWATWLVIGALAGGLVLARQQLAGALARNVGAVWQIRTTLGDHVDPAAQEYAAAAFRQALTWNAADAAASWHLGQVEDQLGHDGAALGAWRPVSAAPSWLLEDGKRAVLRRDVSPAQSDLALRRFGQAVALAPEWPEGHYWIGRSHAGRGDWLAARADFERAPGNESACRALAEFYFKRHQTREVLRWWIAAAEAAPPGSLDSQLHVGQTYLELGEADAAVAAYSRAVQLQPTNPVPWVGLGRADEVAGRTGDARAAYHEAAVRAPDNAEARAGLQRVGNQ